MRKINNFRELMAELEKCNKLHSNVTDMLLELDVLPSTTTQAALNDFLVIIGKRINNGEKIIITAVDEEKALSMQEYNNWLETEFTQYSYNMYVNTMKGKL